MNCCCNGDTKCLLHAEQSKKGLDYVLYNKKCKNP